MTYRGGNRSRRESIPPSLPVLEIVTDTSQRVQHVNQSFEAFTGFTRDEVIGRKCNFLQGEYTAREDLMDLRLAVESRRETTVVVLNYTKDKKPFWNILRIRPVFDNATNEHPPVLRLYLGEIFTLPVPDYMNFGSGAPRLCLDDALALIRVVNSVPRAVSRSDFKVLSLQDTPLKEEEEDDDDPSPEKPSSSSSASSSDEAGPHDEDPSTADEEEEDETPQSPPSAPVTPQPVVLQRHINYAQKLASPDAPPGRDLTPSPCPAKYEFVAETLLPTKNGRFRVRAYRDAMSGAEPLALIVGDVEGRTDVLCRVHDQCQTSEVFGSLRCDCKEQLDHAMELIQQQQGIVMYLPQEGRGIGIANKIAAYAAQELGLDTVDANRHLGLPDDAREYHAVQQILADLKIPSIRLLTNNPRKLTELRSLGIEITERVPSVTVPNSPFAAMYQQTKAERMAHMFGL